MAWRSAFGATVLLALVALHASTALPTVHDMLVEMAGSDNIQTLETGLETMVPDDRDRMLDFWQDKALRCSEYFFGHAKRWHNLVCIEGPLMDSDPTCRKLWDTIGKWEKTCYSRLEKEVQSELDAMSVSTREQYKLFAEQDQRECRSGGQPALLLFDKSIKVVGKLRRLIGSPKDTDADELKVAERFVSACREVIASDSIQTARTGYEEQTPYSSWPHYPHIRFYDFCRRLLELDLSIEKIDNKDSRATIAVRFSEKLAEIQERSQSKANPEALLSETAESVRERERSVAEAAVQIAERNPNLIRRAGDTEWVQAVENELKRLRDQCSYVLDQVANLIWMHQHMYDLLDREREDQGTAYDEQNLMYSEACKQLGQLKNEEIMKVAGLGADGSATEKRKPRNSIPSLLTYFGSKSA
jgi:hypothetical protein